MFSNFFVYICLFQVHKILVTRDHFGYLLRTTVIALRGERGLKSSSAVKIADLDINLEPVH